MSSFLDSTGLSELASQLKSYFCKRNGTYPGIISGELYNACVKWDGAGGRGRLLTYNYPGSNTTGVIVYLSAFDTSSVMRGDAILKITGRGNTFNAKMYHLTGTHLRGWINIEVTVDSTNGQAHVYCYSSHADWMYVCGTLLFEGAWGGNQYKVDMARSTAASSTQKVGSDVSIDSYYIPHSAGTGAGSSNCPVYVDTNGQVQPADNFIRKGTYKEISPTNDVNTFCASGSTSGSFSNKMFGGAVDTTNVWYDIILRLNLSNASSIKTWLGFTGNYPMVHIVATRQVGYVEFTDALSFRTVRTKYNSDGSIDQTLHVVIA